MIHVVTAFFLVRFYRQRKEMRAELRHQTENLQRATDFAEQASRTKSRFLANVSHEVRTPLNLILGMADLLEETSLNVEQKNYVSTFKRSGKHLLGIINDILDVARIESGEVAYEERDVDLISVIEAVSDFVSTACRTKKLSYNYYVEPTVPRYIKGDPTRIRQILINLINNAMKFTQKGEISLGVYCADTVDAVTGKKNLYFEVKDTGIGIPQKEVDKIFKEFYQVDSASTRSQGGVGLGLSIVKTYVDHLGGTIDVRSKVGVGTTFTVRFAVTPILGEGWLKEVSIHHPAIAGRKIFLLTPNLTLRRFLKESFESFGCKVVCAEFGRLGLNIALDEDFDHYIIDVIGQDMNGLEFIRQLEPESTERFIVLCPLVHRNKDTATFKELHITNICYTPIKLNDLVSCMLHEKPIGLKNVLAFRNVPKSQDAPGALKVLIAEDDVDNQNLIKAYLAQYDVEHDFAENGQIAFDRYIRSPEKLDLVITDLQMPIIDGFELIKKIRHYEKEKSLEPIPIVVLTADAQPDQIRNMRNLGGNEYITKPVSKNKLIELLGRYVA